MSGHLLEGFLPRAGALLIQSSLLLAVGLLAGRLLTRRGPVLRAAVYRATLMALALGVPLSIAAAGRTPALWSLQKPAPVVSEPALQPAATGPISLPTIKPPVITAGRDLPVPQTSPTPAMAPRPAAVSWPLLLAAVWLTGAGALLGWMLLCHLRLSWLTRRAVEPQDAELDHTLRDLCSGGRTPRVVVSPGVSSPFLAGLRRPAIFLPASYAQDFNPTALRAILAHELAHLERRDCAWNLLGRLLCALLWPQPLLWLLCRELEQASEEACDAAVVAAAISPTAYARCLVQLADRLFPSQPDRAVGMGVLPLKSSLGKRVEQILSATLSAPQTLSWRARGVVALGALCLLVTAPLLVTSSAAAPQPRPKEEKPVITPPLRPEEGALIGRVVDEQGAPVGNAQVYALLKDRPEAVAFGAPIDYLAFAKTEAHGYFAVRGLRQGSYYITVDDPLKQRVVAAVQVDAFPGEVKEAPDLKLGAGSWIEGILTDSATGRPIAGVHLGGTSADRPKGSMPDLDVVTDVNGKFRLQVAPGPVELWPVGPADGEPDLRSSVSEYRKPLPGAPRVTLTLGTGETRQLALKADGKRYGGGTLVGRLVFEDGKPAAGYEVFCQPGKGNFSRWHGDRMKTAADGSFRLSGLGAGPYNVMVIEDSGEWVATAVEGAESKLRETRTLPDLVFTRGGFVEGVVVDDDTGKPLENVGVGCYGPARPRTSAAILRATTDKQGKFRLRVAPGLNYLYLSDGKYIGKTNDPEGEGGQDILVKAGETQTLSFRAIPRQPRR